MLTIVTWNPWKFKEMASFLPKDIDVQQLDLDVPEIQTNIIKDISYDKCLQAYVEVQWPVLVDDSWIYFDAYHEFPWALTKFLYKGIWLEWIEKLFKGVANKSAMFQSVVSYMDSDLLEPIQFVWEVSWIVSFDYYNDIQEDTSLPYDLIFIPEDMKKPAIFNMDLWQAEYNHRVRAVKKFANWISVDK